MDHASVKHVCNTYINASHPVFDLVSPAFGAFLDKCYTMLQRPPVGHGNAWMVYCDMLAIIRQQEEAWTLQESMICAKSHDDEVLSLIEGLKDLPFDETDGNYYMGGVGGGLGLCKLNLFHSSGDLTKCAQRKNISGHWMTLMVKSLILTMAMMVLLPLFQCFLMTKAMTMMIHS